MEAAQKNDLKAFDNLFWKHIGHVFNNFFRTFWAGITNSHAISSPTKGVSRRYYKILNRYSAALALFADLAMFSLGGTLKRREKISARLGDILSNLYMASGVMKRFHDEGCQKDDEALMHWSMRTLIYTTQEVFHNLLRNFPNRTIARILRFVIFPWGRMYSNPVDSYGKNISAILLNSSASRDRLVSGVYIPKDDKHNYGLLQMTLEKVEACEKLEFRVQQASRQGKIKGDHFVELVAAAEKASILTAEEAAALYDMESFRQRIIAVDDFASEDLFPSAGKIE